MKLIFLIFIFLSNLRAITIFTDGFTNSITNDKKIISYSNVKATNVSGWGISLSNWGEPGYIISTNIILPKGYEWESLIYMWSILTQVGAGPLNPKLNIQILDITNNIITNISFANEGRIVFSINKITNSEIKLRAQFSNAPSGNKSPFLDYWILTIRKRYTPEPYEPFNVGKFYGAPSPFKISEGKEMRFYYKVEEESYITIKIFDNDYNLVKIINNRRHYNLGSNIDAAWDGKNECGVKVMSGVYIAVMEIERIDGSKRKIEPFIFSVIK